ncbi:MAG: hypothetical protein K2Q18_09570, partial [Bdellovibrionales bacterium]|nr:hypothetical protein [Bdellovibrionales bacterium]
MKPMTFKTKILVSILVTSILPLIAISIYSLVNSKNQLEHAAFNELSIIRDTKNSIISNYLDSVGTGVVSLASNDTVLIAATEFIDAYNTLPSATEETRKNLSKYYLNDFANEYKSKTGKE